ncbi:hypothetical protein IP91_04881 [Pseudoduganella lurida]|uniref:DUF4350 domain-containing protein n=1 Tax=Pseudoduganella lurida TaxID=1036180 RepID=A0A562QVX8_9BURK|nr:DUF4350 domain-containing protein [Pseudoduganella lurida]TWI60917.1 hypothetical protein IP91_04881 [Pseudoduganella lurida]
MSTRLKWLLACLAAVLLAAGATWLWHAAFEKRVRAVPEESEAARDNPRLAATRLLQRHGHPVAAAEVLGSRLLARLPAGMLVLPARTAIDRKQAAPLLDWVRRGNTLVVQPAWIARPPKDGVLPGKAADPDADPIGGRYGVALAARTRQDDTCRADESEVRRALQDQEDEEEEAEEEKEEDAEERPVRPQSRLVCVTPPGTRYPLELDRPFEVLQPEGRTRPLWGDTYGLGVQVYAEGRGRVVLVAQDYFSHNVLRQHDHGELLLVLARLAGPATQVTFVQSGQRQTWTGELWERFWPALCAAAALVLLWAWSAARRFGPTLPAPAGGSGQPRRALLEHVDASGRWLWSVPGGRALLLAAVRTAVEARLRRHAPELLHLDRAERLRQLADRTALPRADLERALHGEPARRAADFTRQISTLQRLRAHHER